MSKKKNQNKEIEEEQTGMIKVGDCITDEYFKKYSTEVKHGHMGDIRKKIIDYVKANPYRNDDTIARELCIRRQHVNNVLNREVKNGNCLRAKIPQIASNGIENKIVSKWIKE